MTQNSVAVYTYANIISALEDYRLFGPLTHAGMKINRGVHDGAFTTDVISKSDVVLFQREFPVNFPNYQALMTRAAESGKNVIVDMDDDLLALPLHHPDRLKLYYADAQVPMLMAMIQAKALTVTTPYLANLLKVYNTNVFVLPNYLNDSIWKFNPPQTPNGKKIRILFMGGITHVPDLKMLLPAIRTLASKYPNQLEFIFYGANLEISEPLPVTITNLISETYVYGDYVRIALGQSADIAIAPLEDNDFNRCKSNIKYLEYTAMGLPGVYSKVLPYSDVIKQGNNGYVAKSTDDWVKALSRLIEDPQTRTRIINAAQDDVQKNWLMSNHAQLWPDTFAEISRFTAPNKSKLVPFIPTFTSISGQLHLLYQAQIKRESDLSLDVEHLTYDLETARKANAWALSEIKRVDDEKNEVIHQRDNLIEPLLQEKDMVILQKDRQIEQLEDEKARDQLLLKEKNDELLVKETIIEQIEQEKEKIFLPKERQIEHVEGENAKIRNVIKEKNDEILIKDTLIEQLMRDKETVVLQKGELQQQLESREAIIKRDISALEKQVDNLSVQWFEHTNQISTLESENKYYKQALDLSKLENIDYVLSTSWQITRPFRKIAKHLRRK